jgi:hypothetical protein
MAHSEPQNSLVGLYFVSLRSSRDAATEDSQWQNSVCQQRPEGGTGIYHYGTAAQRPLALKGALLSRSETQSSWGSLQCN